MGIAALVCCTLRIRGAGRVYAAARCVGQIACRPVAAVRITLALELDGALSHLANMGEGAVRVFRCIRLRIFPPHISSPDYSRPYRRTLIHTRFVQI